MMKKTAFAFAAVLAAGCGGTKVPTEISAQDPAVHYAARYDEAASADPRFSLPGSAISFRFTGTSLTVKLDENTGAVDSTGNKRHNFYDVFIDDQPPVVLEANEGPGSYPLATGLAERTHDFRMVKRTEAWIGDTKVKGFLVDPDARVSASPTSDRRLEFVGDSITVGVGDEGPNEKCTYSAQYQNHDVAYPALIANALGAEHIAMAASGIGVVVNYGGKTENTMLDIYDRANITDVQSKWHFDWQPQAVVVNLGTSDFTNGDPGQAPFVDRYVAILQRIRRAYPSAFILAVVGPMLNDSYPVGAQSLTKARAYVQSAVAAAKSAGDANLDFFELTQDDGSHGFGCDYHPNRETHAAIASQLIPVLKAHLGW